MLGFFPSFFGPLKGVERKAQTLGWRHSTCLWDDNKPPPHGWFWKGLWVEAAPVFNAGAQSILSPGW